MSNGLLNYIQYRDSNINIYENNPTLFDIVFIFTN